MIAMLAWDAPPTPEDWLTVYDYCRERAYEERGMPVGDAEMWANFEADRLVYGLTYGLIEGP